MNRRELGLVIAGVFLGILPGYLIGTSLTLSDTDVKEIAISEEAVGRPEEDTSSMGRPQVPKTEGECAVMVSQALTDRGASLMEAYCFNIFPNFLSDK